MLVKTVFALTIYHAVIEVKITIAATEKTVMKSDQKNAVPNPVWVKPFIKFSAPEKVWLFGSVKGASVIENLYLSEFIMIIKIGERKTIDKKSNKTKIAPCEKCFLIIVQPLFCGLI